MDSIDITAKTLDEARRLAAAELGASVDSIDVTILEEVKGLFGKSSVRIRASRAEAEDPIVSAPVTAPEPEPEPVTAQVAAAVDPISVQEVMAVESALDVSAESEAEADADINAGTEDENGEPAVVTVEVVATEADGAVMEQHLTSLMAAADLAVDVKVSAISGKYVNLEIDGKDVGYLVGKHGEALNAMQYLTNIMANKRLANGVRVVLDGNQYRRRREEKLTEMSQKIAQQVKKRGEEAVLDALPAFERRIVHKALAGIKGISTYSEGEEPNRRVVIAPVD